MSKEFVIEKGIPLPASTNSRNTYPWAQMEIGDSFLVEPDSCSAGSFAGMANRQYAPKRFSGRKEGTGRRIWRVQ